MVYNAMKLFMEVNPQLFDDCSHEYTEHENNKKAIEASRQAKWDHIAQLAEARKAARSGQQNGHHGATRPPGYAGAKTVTTSPGIQEEEEDSAGRLERLRLGEERDRDRRPNEAYERRTSGSGGGGSIR